MLCHVINCYVIERINVNANSSSFLAELIGTLLGPVSSTPDEHTTQRNVLTIDLIQYLQLEPLLTDGLIVLDFR